MTNNDVLRSLRYTFDYNDEQMIDIFALEGQTVTRALVNQWLKKEEDPSYLDCNDEELSTFLNGLITQKRGRKDGGAPAPVEKEITNNDIFRKIKIALNLQSTDVLEIMKEANLNMSNSELTAFFRKPGHKNYRICKNQILRNFLKGLRMKYRPSEESAESSDSEW